MCTGIRFNDPEGNLYFARNLDWNTRYGERVVITPKGFDIPYRFIEPAKSQHNIIGMAVAAGNFPMYFDCGNDAGLAVAGLNFPGFASFPEEPIEGKDNVTAYEFPLWVVATFDSVDAVEEALRNVMINGSPFQPGGTVALLHWIIGDGKRSIVVEQTADGLHVYDDPVDVLTNQPEFPWHLTNLRTYITATNTMPENPVWGKMELVPFGAGSGARGIPGDSYTTSRFVKEAFTHVNYPQKDNEAENVSRAFHTLSAVAMIDGSSQMADGTFEVTLYTGCYSARTQTYYYSTYEDPAIIATPMSDYLNDSTDPSKIIVI